VSFGKNQPIAPNDTPEDRRINIEIQYQTPRNKSSIELRARLARSQKSTLQVGTFE